MDIPGDVLETYLAIAAKKNMDAAIEAFFSEQADLIAEWK